MSSSPAQCLRHFVTAQCLRRFLRACQVIRMCHVPVAFGHCRDHGAALRHGLHPQRRSWRKGAFQCVRRHCSLQRVLGHGLGFKSSKERGDTYTTSLSF